MCKAPDATEWQRHFAYWATPQMGCTCVSRINQNQLFVVESPQNRFVCGF